MHQRTVIGVLVVVLAATAGCKKSVEGEQARWKSANRTADKAAALYPGFKQAIEERRGQANKVHDEAQKLDDEKAKISKLSEANGLLATGFVAELVKIDEKLGELRSQMIEAAGNQGVDKARADEAIAQTKAIVSKVESALERGAADAKAAEVVVNKVIADLTEAKGHLASVAPKKETGDTAKAGKAGAAEPAGDPQAAKWTCGYCDHQNEPGAHKCANCGAPRDSKKAP